MRNKGPTVKGMDLIAMVKTLWLWEKTIKISADLMLCFVQKLHHHFLFQQGSYAFTKEKMCYLLRHGIH
jgi:hypothetical protein